MTGGGKRGSKPLTARDWIFGSRPRRLALRFVLRTPPPAAGWTKTEIAKHCEVGAKGGADEHVRGLLALKVITERDGRYLPTTPMSPLAERLRELVGALETVPEQRVDVILSRHADRKARARTRATRG
jgi:hypothetical protein